MPKERSGAASQIRETVLAIAEPRRPTAADGLMDGGRMAPDPFGHGDVDMYSVMTRGERTEAGWWPLSWWHVSSGGLLQK